jgi:uncharacterized protein (TIGR02246 family)
MKHILSFILFYVMLTTCLYAQDVSNKLQQRQNIEALIDQYAQAREEQDTVLLKSLLTLDVDQLVSSGEWRQGIEGSMQGMQRSSSSNPGERVLTVDKVRFLSPETAIVDARYEIHNTDGTVRKMWSTFVVVQEEGAWKITAIRNMLPAGSA